MNNKIKIAPYLKDNKNYFLITLCFLFISAFIFSIIPILYSSFYAHPLYDDFAFSKKVHDTILNNGNIFDVIYASISQVKETYLNWQGTFSAIFLFTLQPAVFSENLYFLTTFILVFSLSISTYFFLDTIIVKWLDSKRIYSLIITSFTLICQIQFVVDKTEAFFWFNGAIYYTFFYSLSLTLFALITRIYLSDKISRKIILCITASFLAVIIGGGNYTTALTTCILLILTIIAIIKSKDRHKQLYFIILGFLIVSFIINAAAPGNSVRAEGCNGMPAIKAIIMSILYSGAFIGEWTHLPQIVFSVFITPFLFNTARNTNYKFKHPFIAVITSFLCFATQFTPTLFAMGSVGAGRQRNIYYYSYYLLVIFNIFYICGWFSHNINFEKVFFTKYKLLFVVITGLFFTIGCVQYRKNLPTSLDTALAIRNGTVQQYDEEYKKAIEQIKSGNSEIEEIKTAPAFLGKLGIEKDSEDKNFWVNKAISRYYHVDYFYLKNTDFD